MASTTLSRPRATPSRPTVRRRRRWLRWLVLAVAVVLVGTGGWLVGFSSALATRQVEVSTGERLSRSQVRRQAAVVMGVPLVRQDLSDIASRVAMLRPVERVRVERRWPDTVVINVTERTPVIAVRSPDGFALVDRYGIAFADAARIEDGILLAAVNPGDVRLLTDVAHVSGTLPGRLRERVDQLQATSPTTIQLVLDSGVRVSWGSSESSELKSDIVLALLEQKPRAIDVSAPHHPAVR